MKTKRFLFAICMVILTKTLHAQFPLEATYTPSFGTVYMVNLEVDGEKYIRLRFEHNDRKVQLYNLDHSLWKTISLSGLPINLNWIEPGSGDSIFFDYDILYVTQHLFNLDDNIELMYVAEPADSRMRTRIIDEFGNILFSADAAGPAVKANVPQVQKPIYNTVAGTKMILSGYNGSVPEVKVYGLPGVLTHENEMPLSGNNGFAEINSYPNPARDYVIIQYELPKTVNDGVIILYDTNGNLLKRFIVDRSFHDLRISTNEFPSGTYFYQLQTTAGIESRKMIVLK